MWRRIFRWSRGIGGILALIYAALNLFAFAGNTDEQVRVRAGFDNLYAWLFGQRIGLVAAIDVETGGGTGTGVGGGTGAGVGGGTANTGGGGASNLPANVIAAGYRFFPKVSSSDQIGFATELANKLKRVGLLVFAVDAESGVELCRNRTVSVIYYRKVDEGAANEVAKLIHDLSSMSATIALVNAPSTPQFLSICMNKPK